MWVDAVAMGTTLIKRELLNKIPFMIPQVNLMSDDTAYCLEARKNHQKIIAGFGLLVPHWGYDLQMTSLPKSDFTHIRVTVDNQMTTRRRQMHEDGVYVR